MYACVYECVFLADCINYDNFIHPPLSLVLPRFEVTLDAPKQLEREEDIELTVSAKYVFGENVQGSVKLNATLEASSRRESLPFHDRTISLVRGWDGQYSTNVYDA